MLLVLVITDCGLQRKVQLRKKKKDAMSVRESFLKKLV